MRRVVAGLLAAVVLVTIPLVAQPAATGYACAGLIGSNGNVNLGRTTTLAGYHDGVEHYVTAFEFLGGGGEFGSLIPLPGVPTEIVRGGDWTLQRLNLETAPSAASAGGGVGSAGGAGVLQEVRIDALDITILKGGSADVAQWATENGFRLSPDAPEVLHFYAQRSPIFMAAVFDGEAAAERGQVIGDGTPVHLTIPTDDPWVPLRILGLGKQAQDIVQADVYLLTDVKPTTLPVPDGERLTQVYSEQASELLLSDLRSDQGMSWVPEEAWLTKVVVGAPAGELQYDLAVDETGTGAPSARAAGLGLPRTGAAPQEGDAARDWGLAAGGLALLAGVVVAVFVGERTRR